MQAKREQQAQARQMRSEGLSVRAIAKALGVAKSSVSVWVRDVPLPAPEPPAAAPPAPPPPPAQGERACSRCRELLPLAAFNRSGDSHQWYCRACFKNYVAERRALLSAQNERARARRRGVAQRFVLEHLARHVCADCGDDRVGVLEFDHIGAKAANVADLVGGGVALHRVLVEIGQCEVVCANCHRLRTARRRGSFRLTLQPAPSWDSLQLRNHVLVYLFLAAQPCIDCAEGRPVVLDFDHRGDKIANVAELVGHASVKRLFAEVAKCDVRCANCHRLRTRRDRGDYRIAASAAGSAPAGT